MSFWPLIGQYSSSGYFWPIAVTTLLRIVSVAAAIARAIAVRLRLIAGANSWYSHKRTLPMSLTWSGKKPDPSSVKPFRADTKNVL